MYKTLIDIISQRQMTDSEKHVDIIKLKEKCILNNH